MSGKQGQTDTSIQILEKETCSTNVCHTQNFPSAAEVGTKHSLIYSKLQHLCLTKLHRVAVVDQCELTSIHVCITVNTSPVGFCGLFEHQIWYNLHVHVVL